MVVWHVLKQVIGLPAPDIALTIPLVLVSEKSTEWKKGRYTFVWSGLISWVWEGDLCGI